MAWLTRACIGLESSYQQPFYAECHDAQSIRCWGVRSMRCPRTGTKSAGSQRAERLHTNSFANFAACTEYYRICTIVLAAYRGSPRPREAERANVWALLARLAGETQLSSLLFSCFCLFVSRKESCSRFLGPVAGEAGFQSSVASSEPPNRAWRQAKEGGRAPAEQAISGE